MCQEHDLEERKNMHPTCNLFYGLHHIASLQDPLDPCPGVNGDITQYLISFQTGSVMDIENVTVAGCISGRCSHAFEPSSNPPSSYDGVSVAAENVVGVGAERTCTAQTICKCPVKYFLNQHDAKIICSSN